MVRRIAPKKPVVVWKGGLTAQGSRAAASHTGSLAGQEAIWNAFFRQSGAIRVDSIDQMVDVLIGLCRLPRFTGRGVGLMGGAGGNSVAAADICARAGLDVPALSEEIQQELRTFIGVAGTSVRNPMDVGMQLRGPDDFVRVTGFLARDPAIDAIVIEMHPWWGRFGGARRARRMMDNLARFAAAAEGGKPVIIALRGAGESLDSAKARLRMMQRFSEAGVPVFQGVERASTAIAKITEYYRWVQEAEG